MQLRPLGHTGIQVSELSLGGLYTSSLGGGGDETVQLLSAAAEMGINYCDTAPAYADSEATLGKALQESGKPFIVSTKFGGRPTPFDPQNVAQLKESLAESRRLLGRDQIDILLIHEPDRPLQYNWWNSFRPLAGPVLDLLQELKASGQVKAIGLAGTTVAEMTSLVRTGLFDVLLTAFNYNLLFREAEEELLPAAKEQGMGVIIGSALGQGFLSRRFDKEVLDRPYWMSRRRREQLLRLYTFVEETGFDLPELCLRFVLSNPDISTVLIGAKTRQQLEASVNGAKLGPLEPETLEQLHELATMLPHRPYEEPMILPLGKQYYGPGIANMGGAVQVGKS
ncbi:aldo/keto reductase [Blastopirellula marina]|uniref:dTDP-4-keto-L-6-deoxy-hexose 2,3-reductase-putative aNADP-dependent oxidoreductase n=1 Tax=Blastopirellula marina DSM 3645 TaxID=314230 RepID=A3ZZM2_9BACT|nr:aldo/keto reductase [Blastopirellula marina]EAQ78037.1 dTDP-4-keto-L-6-deoxy-hexose 2,3-reductase-putative aNADP-dependent oxidoreductase [Blastopirellula marina DSM 3645]